jgi:hypothetical protein
MAKVISILKKQIHSELQSYALELKAIDRLLAQHQSKKQGRTQKQTHGIFPWISLLKGWLIKSKT